MENKTTIAIFCYKRADKLKGCVEALLKNPECISSEVTFFSDGYKGEKDKAGVLETRAYINTVTGFKKINTVIREKNYGAGLNTEEGLKYLSANYDRFILIEDDLLVSSNYVSYMNEALDFYKDSKEVFCVAGFVFPMKAADYPYDTFVYTRFTSWGWASWAERVKPIIWDMAELKRISETSPGFKKRLNTEGRDLHRLLLKQIEGVKVWAWDIQVQVHVSENRMKVIYPVVSKINNIGFDVDSTHTYGINYLKTPLDRSNKHKFNFCDVKTINPSLQKQLFRPYRLDQLVKRKLINEWIAVYRKVLGKS